MKKTFKLLILCILLLPNSLWATILPSDSAQMKGNTELPHKHVLLTGQFAGSIGFWSLGTGITNRAHTIHHELLYGSLPEAYGGPMSKLTYKATYLPFRVKLNNRVTWRPLNVTGFAAYHIGKKFTLLHSFKKYEKGYYPWSPALRFHVGFSTAFDVKQRSGRDLTFYLETNTNDLYISTLFDNVGYMSFTDIWFLGMGVKMQLLHIR